MRHQQLGTPDELAVLLSFDGTHGNLTAFFYAQAVGLPCVHLCVSCAVAMKGTLANLRVDASWDEEGDVDVVVFEFQ